MTKGPNWLTEEEAMEKLGYRKSSLRIYTRTEGRKKLPIRTAKISKTKILYSGTDIDAYINQKATA